MVHSRQTLESIQSDFDRIALVSDERCDNPTDYEEYLAKQIPEQCGNVLEIGCGTGRFSRMLARRAEKVLAIDLSPQMICLTQKHSTLHKNIEFVVADAMTYELPDDHFDCIATVTTMHHLPTKPILAKIKKALKPGGVFVCLDLYQRSTLTDLMFDSIAYAANIFLSLIKTGPRASREFREAYAEHGKTDTYLTLGQIKEIFADVLPGAVVKRHLFWRYSVVWKKRSSEK
jgi:ubiquinone/menaquinone biosynthesis C-methylase UbiE